MTSLFFFCIRSESPPHCFTRVDPNSNCPCASRWSNRNWVFQSQGTKYLYQMGKQDNSKSSVDTEYELVPISRNPSRIRFYRISSNVCILRYHKWTVSRRAQLRPVLPQSRNKLMILLLSDMHRVA